MDRTSRTLQMDRMSRTHGMYRLSHTPLVNRASLALPLLDRTSHALHLHAHRAPLLRRFAAARFSLLYIEKH